MTPRLKLFSAALALAASLAAPTARAAGPIIDWDPAFFFDPASTPTFSAPGNQLRIVGTISQFDGPLVGLNANMAVAEYTFYCQGLISTGTSTVGPPTTQFYTTTYVGGTIEVYEDFTPNAQFAPNPPNGAVPSSFNDGTLILSGVFTSFVTQTNNFTAFQTGNAEGAIQWTGGSLLGLLNAPGGQTCPALLTGGMTWHPPVMIPGYLFRHDGKIDENCPTTANGSTWGKLKSLYR